MAQAPDISRFIRAIQQIDLDSSAHEPIADFFFLAAEGWCFFGEPSVSAPLRDLGPSEQSRGTTSRKGKATLSKEEVITSPDPRGPSAQDRAIFPVSGLEVSAGIKASRIDIPDPPGLSNPLAIARALRPLSRRIRSIHSVEIDETATAESSAHSQQLSIVFRPRAERWFDLLMVVEDTLSMAVWAKTLDELQRLLGSHGAFRDVRRVKLRATQDGVRLVSPSGRLGDPRSLIDPGGRRLMLLFTHGVGESWRYEALDRVLLDWCSHQLVAIVQMLPPEQWEQTTLGEPEALARPSRPGLANRNWMSVRPYLEELLRPGGAPVPIIPLRHTELTMLSRTIMAHASSSIAATHISANTTLEVERPSQQENRAPANPLSPSKHLSPETLVARFRMNASRQAIRLAIALAGSPLTLPVMRLVQRTIFKPAEVEQVHLAEVLLSGLLYQVRRTEDVETDLFEFFDGVRSVLAQSLPVHERLTVRQKVFAYIREHPDAVRVFPGLVPDHKGSEFIPFWASPFAEDYTDFQRENLRVPALVSDGVGKIKSWFLSVGSSGRPPILIVAGGRDSNLPLRHLLDTPSWPRKTVFVWVDLDALSPFPDNAAIVRAIAREAGWSMDDILSAEQPLSAYDLDLRSWLEQKIHSSRDLLLIALEYSQNYLGLRYSLQWLIDIAVAVPPVFSLMLVDFPIGEIPINDWSLTELVVLKPPSEDVQVARLRLLQRGHPPEWTDDHYWKLHNSRSYELAEEYCRLVLCADNGAKAARAYLTHLVGEHLGRKLEAETMLREGIALDDSDPNMHYNLAQLLAETGRREEALTEFDRTSRLVGPKDRSQVIARKVALLIDMNQIDEAIAQYREAFKLHPNQSSANTFVWSLYKRNVRLEVAEEIGLIAFELDRSEIHMLQTMAAIFLRRGKWLSAVPLVEAWIKGIETDELKAKWYDFGLMFRDAVQIDRAAEMAELLVRTAPNDTVWSAVAEALRRAKDEDARTPTKEASETVTELVRQLTGAVHNLRFPGTPAVTSIDR